MQDPNIHSIGKQMVRPIMHCGNPIMYVVEAEKGFLIMPKEIIPTKGDHDYKKCEGCQTYYSNLLQHLTNLFYQEGEGNFPNCCDGHKNLAKIKEFRKEAYSHVPEMVAQKVMFTRQHIINVIENDDYYGDITDYIEYAIQSFGQMPTNCGGPLFYGEYIQGVESLLNDIKGDEEQKASKIKKYLLTQIGNEVPKEKLSIQTLFNTYNKWLKTFPFELSWFTDMKSHFESQLPIIRNKPRRNRYSGDVTFTFKSREEMIILLNDLTVKILDRVGDITKGAGDVSIAEHTKQELNLATTIFRLKHNENLKKFEKDELDYVKTLKNWAKMSKQFLSDIQPLIEKLPPPPPEFVFDNNFDSVPYHKVYEHFRQGLVASKYLSLEELHRYLKLAFEECSSIEDRFSFAEAHKKKVTAVFYKYYKDVAGKPHGKQNKYAALLGEYFLGYKTRTLITNFSR